MLTYWGGRLVHGFEDMGSEGAMVTGDMVRDAFWWRGSLDRGLWRLASWTTSMNYQYSFFLFLIIPYIPGVDNYCISPG